MIHFLTTKNLKRFLDKLHETFAHILHTHTIAQVDGLQTELNSKSDIVHQHTIADVALLQDTIDRLEEQGGLPHVAFYEIDDLEDGVYICEQIGEGGRGILFVKSGATEMQQDLVGNCTPMYRHGHRSDWGEAWEYEDWRLMRTEAITDNTLSNQSELPVQNKVIKAALDKKAPFDHVHDEYALFEHTHVLTDIPEIGSLDNLANLDSDAINNLFAIDVETEIHSLVNMSPAEAQEELIALLASGCINAIVLMPDKSVYRILNGVGYYLPQLFQSMSLDGGKHTLEHDYNTSRVYFDDGTVLNEMSNAGLTQATSPLSGQPMVQHDGQYHYMQMHDVMMIISRLIQVTGISF